MEDNILIFLFHADSNILYKLYRLFKFKSTKVFTKCVSFIEYKIKLLRLIKLYIDEFYTI